MGMVTTDSRKWQRFIWLLCTLVMGCILLAACSGTAGQTDFSDEVSVVGGGDATNVIGSTTTATASHRTTTSQLSASIPDGWGEDVVPDDEPVVGTVTTVVTPTDGTSRSTATSTTSSESSSETTATTTYGEYFPGVW